MTIHYFTYGRTLSYTGLKAEHFLGLYPQISECGLDKLFENFLRLPILGGDDNVRQEISELAAEFDLAHKVRLRTPEAG